MAFLRACRRANDFVVVVVVVMMRNFGLPLFRFINNKPTLCDVLMFRYVLTPRLAVSLNFEKSAALGSCISDPILQNGFFFSRNFISAPLRKSYIHTTIHNNTCYIRHYFPLVRALCAAFICEIAPSRPHTSSLVSLSSYRPY